MDEEAMIAADEFCSHYHAEFAFIQSLHENGLVAIVATSDNYMIPLGELRKTESLTRLHYELQINMEGIEAISHLLQKIEHLQEDVTLFKNRLRNYEKI